MLREDTQFKPGSCPNPGGRPKAEAKVVEAARAAGERCVEVLTDLLDDQDKRVRIEAAKALLDRGFGKPRQEQFVSGEQLLRYWVETLAKRACCLECTPKLR